MQWSSLVFFAILSLSGTVAGAQSPQAIDAGPANLKGNAFNPEMSANTLFLYRNGSRGNSSSDVEPNGFSLQEAELQFFSDVDVYARVAVLLSLHEENGDWHLEPEEAFAESISLPFVTVKAGKFKTSLGKYNTYHTHALPFVDQNLVNQVILGDEGLNNVGLSAAVITSSASLAGVLQVFAYLIVPSIVATSFFKTVKAQLLGGWIFGAMLSLLALILSYKWDFPAGAMIVVCFTIIPIILVLLHPLLSKKKASA